ncbi:MAG: glycoside hydrolase family 2 TIM barrel-domain containing protein, partial [Blastocatellia bacterium]
NIAPNGTVITTEVNGADAVVTVKTKVENESDQPARFQLTDEITGAGKAGPDAAQEIGPWQSREVVHRIPIKAAHLWSTEDPNLYRLDSTLTVGNAPVDSVSTTFGVRTIRFDKDSGFYLNGKRVEIKGVCDHQDHAGVGSAVPDRLNAWRLEQLKIYGINALRTSHNPPTPSVLDACDRLGILVMDENRLIGSSPETLSQVTRLIERDRNHPSVIMWSIGNEEWVEQTNMRARRIAASMKRTIKELDSTRPVTYASNAGNSDTGINSVVDLRGFNYKNVSNIDKYHSEHPDQILYGSEEASTVSTRGIYANDKQKGYVSAYDLNRPGWGALAEDWWTFYDARPFLAGAFVWTGFDYRGEPTPYKWPCINSHFGILDTCGFPKDIAFYY